MYSGVDSGVLKCWVSIGFIKENIICSGLWCVEILVSNKFIKENDSGVDSGVLKCWFSIAFIKETVVWAGFWCVKMLIFYWLYTGTCFL